MNPRGIICVSLIAALLSACAAKAPAVTSTPAASTTPPPATPTSAPAATLTPVEAPTVTATLTLAVPTNLPNCTNQASFVNDATIPDNSPLAAGTVFTKTWTVKNTGTCTWGPDYTLAPYSDENMSAPNSVPLVVTLPGQTADISVALAAPTGLGLHKGYFVIKNPAGLIMKIDADSRLWVIINVTSAVAINGTATPSIGSGSGTPTSVSGTNPVSTATGPGFVDVTCAYTVEAAKVAEAINAINAYRAQNGLAAYPVNDLLTRAAQAHADDMACNGLFTHTGSDGSTPRSRVAASGYVASDMSENVYGSYPPLTGQGVVTWWMNDKTDTRHNLNLISTKFTEIGVGYAFFDNFGYYVVVFAAP